VWARTSRSVMPACNMEYRGRSVISQRPSGGAGGRSGVEKGRERVQGCDMVFVRSSECMLAALLTGGTLDPCQECGQFQLSGWGSTSRGACECIAGHGYNSTDPASAVCEPCPLGTFYIGPEDTERPYSRSYGAKSANAKIQGAGFADGRDGLTDASRRRGICVECSTELRGGVTTLLTGARSPKECVCSPGG
jgi:hypothetical protein